MMTHSDSEMALETRRTGVRIDQDGVRIVRTSGVRRSVWALAAVLIALALLFLLLRPGQQAVHDNPADRDQASAPSIAKAPPAPPPAFKPVRRTDRAEPSQVEISHDEPAKAPEALQERPENATEDDSEGEELSGIALFPPPGTDPIKRGLIVPEDFELPPGYVRHYQATDDGQRLPAILMFHPDYDWVDKDGNRIEISADHIVPAELAPAGLPLQTLDVAEPQIPMIEEPRDGEAAD